MTFGENEAKRPAAEARLDRRRLLRWVGLGGLAAGWAPALAACAQGAGSAPPAGGARAEALLLSPADFPGRPVQPAQQFTQREATAGGQTAQVVLQEGQKQIFQSVVIFPAADAASAALKDLRQGGAGALWRELPEAPRFGQDSLVFSGRQGDREALLAVFRQDRIFERVTVVGTADIDELTLYARRAEEKAKRGGPR